MPPLACVFGTTFMEVHVASDPHQYHGKCDPSLELDGITVVWAALSCCWCILPVLLYSRRETIRMKKSLGTSVIRVGYGTDYGLPKTSRKSHLEWLMNSGSIVPLLPLSFVFPSQLIDVLTKFVPYSEVPCIVQCQESCRHDRWQFNTSQSPSSLFIFD